MKILVISFAGIGDTLFATPLIHELRANFPDSTLDALVRWPAAHGLLQNNPHLNKVWQKDLAADSKISSFLFLWKLRRLRYDFTIVTFPQSRSEYRRVAGFLKARTRISHDYGNFTAADRKFVNQTLPVDYGRHAVQNNLALLPLLGVKPVLPSHRYELYPGEADHAWAQGFITQQQLQLRPLLGVHVGSGATKNLALRRWPLENYVALARQLQEKKPEVAVLFFGGPGEKEAHETIRAAGLKTAFFPKGESLLQSAALIRKCDVFLSVDTSLMHIAAAMGIKNQIVIETPTWNKPIEPFATSFTLIKNPVVAGRNLEYYRYDGGDIKGTPEELIRCMASVKVEEVLEVVTRKMG